MLAVNADSKLVRVYLLSSVNQDILAVPIPSVQQNGHVVITKLVII